jgi:predicted nucleic acid-binding protein
VNSVLLDTSFLITFSNPGRKNHGVADQYFRECLRRGVPMYLSTIALSEFQVKESIQDLPMRNLITLPFNVDHAMRCGALVSAHLGSRDPEDDRVAVKDDLKLIAQCECEGITHILNEDAGTLDKMLQRSQSPILPAVRSVLLKDGFDASWFNNGQHALGMDVEQL